MNKYYTKCILYAYLSIDAIIEQMDKSVEDRAYYSMSDFSPAFDQCLKIISLTDRKDVLIDLKRLTTEILKTFKLEDLRLLEYKYFRSSEKKRYSDIDFRARGYFRKQNKLVEVFSEKLKNRGYTDEWFTSKYLCIDFFKNLYRKVIEIENNSYKNPKKNKGVKRLKISA